MRIFLKTCASSMEFIPNDLILITTVLGMFFRATRKAVLVEKEAHLLELARYIVLNPVKARLVRNAKDWP